MPLSFWNKLVPPWIVPMSQDMSMGSFIAMCVPEIVSPCAKPYASAGSRASSAVRLLLFTTEEIHGSTGKRGNGIESGTGLVRNRGRRRVGHRHYALTTQKKPVGI